jgi:hypothetical protein
MILPQALRAAIYLNITAFAIYILYKLIKRELKQTVIGIQGTTIALKRYNRISTIECTDIIGLKYVQLPFVKGFLHLETPSATLSIPLYVENLKDFVSSFHTCIRDSGKSSLLDQQTFNQLISDSIVYQNAYIRSLSAFRPVIALSILLFSANSLIAKKMWELDLIPQLIWAITGLISPVVTYFISDLFINRIVKRQARLDEQFNKEWFFLQYRFWGLIALILYFFTGIAIRICFS